MDIFTTQLTRVVPVPIKPANLKVKALVKDAGAGKLKEDLDHLENHDYYFDEKKSDKKQTQDEKNKREESKQKECSAVKQAESSNTDSAHADSTYVDSTHADKKQSNDGITETKDGVKHLDLYI